MFRGSAAAKVDAKGRLKIPTEFRRTIQERFGSDLFVTSIQGDSALVYPLTVWEEVEDKLARIPSANRSKMRFLERASYFGQQLNMDAQGRLVVPPILREKAEIAGEVVVSAQLDHLIVWNRERFEERLSDQPFTEEDFSVLAEFGI